MFIVVAIVVVGAVAIALCRPGGDDYKINEIPFQIWVAQHPDFQIQNALAGVGTNAIPHLVRIIREPADSTMAYQLESWIWKRMPQRFRSFFFRSPPVPEWTLKRTALFGLRAFGPEAKAALPDILKLGRSETNKFVQASALVAALSVAPESPDTFSFWREQWNTTNYARRDLATYLRIAYQPYVSAVPLLLEEAKRTQDPTIMEAFEYFGEAARPAMPYMLQLLKNTGNRGDMLEVFLRLGPVASGVVPEVGALLNDSNPAVVAASLQVLSSIGPEARAALPQIQPLLTNDDSTIRMLAASASAHIQAKPELAVPILLQTLENPRRGTANAFMYIQSQQPISPSVTSGSQAAAILLGECGPAARAALPDLEKMLHDPNPATRLFSAQAMWRISRSTSPALPVLLDILNSQPPPQSEQDDTLLMAIEAIEEMGPEAKEAVPSLCRVRTFSMSAHRAVSSALLRVDPAR
jgi:HEAT repeat protein